MSAADIQARLKSLFDATKAIAALTTQLAKWTPDADLAASTSSLTRSTSSHSQPHTLSRSTSSLTAAATDRIVLAADIHQRLKDVEEDYDLLSADAADFSSPRPRRLDAATENVRLALTTQLQRLGEDIAHGRAQFRKAQLQAKRTADAAQRKERQQLLAGLDPASAPRRRRPTEDQGASQVRDAATDVTDALRRTHQRMQAELHRSEFARATLQRSNHALQSLNQSYGSLDEFLRTSRGLIQTLSTSNKSDTWYLETALWILAATIAWLFFRRILFGPVRYLVYLPSKWVLRAVAAVINLILGIFVGASGQLAAPNSSRSVSRVMASGKGATRDPNIPAPSINVGGGAKGAQDPAKPAHDGESLSQKVGAMAEAKMSEEHAPQHPGTVLRERRPDEPRNPKKRMFEEPSGGGETKDRDEL